MKSPHDLADEIEQPALAAPLFSARAWRNFLLVAAPLVAVVLLYFASARSLTTYWNDTDSLTYTHGWIVLAIAIWLLFDALRPLEPFSFKGSWAGVVALFASSVVWLLGRQTNIQLIQQMLLPVLASCVLWGLYGNEIARRCGFALGYLYFAVPLWGEINPVLQWGTVFAMRALVRLAGIPAYFDSNTIHLPSGVIAVEGGCSGLHFFIVGMALATLYWYINRIAAKWRLLMVAAVLAVLANWVRVFVIVVAGYLTNMQHYLVRVEHYRFGWGVFAVMMAIFFFIAHRMKQEPVMTTSASAVPQPSLPRSYLTLTALVLVLLMVPCYVFTLQHRAVPAITVSVVPPAGWQQSSEPVTAWQPSFMNADGSVLQRYTTADAQLDVYRAVYGEQNQQKKIAGYDNSPLGALRNGMEVIATATASGAFRETELSDALGNRELVWAAYSVDDRWFASALRAQLWSGLKTLLAAPRTGVLALHAKCQPDCTVARRAMDQWVTASQLHQLTQLK